MSKRKIIETSQAAYNSLEPDKIQQIYKDMFDFVKNICIFVLSNEVSIRDYEPRLFLSV